MARAQRVHYPGAVYHVIARGNNKEPILSSDRGKNYYLGLIKKYKERFPFNLYGYAIMDNHVHILLEVREDPLSKIMQGIQQSYTQWYNGHYQRVGHVFQQRYKAILCDKDSYLLSLLKYIHSNPVRAGVTETLSYPWSSHRDYLLGTSSLVDVSFCLGVLSDKIKTAKNKYRQFMEEQDFCDIKEENLSSNCLEKGHVHQNKENKIIDIQISLDDLIKAVVGILGITEEWLHSLNSRNRKIVTARNIVVYLAIKHKIAERSVLMERLDLTPYQISRGYYAAAEKEESRSLIRAIEEMQ
jgi:REP element-mobilizing transposase RayT